VRDERGRDRKPARRQRRYAWIVFYIHNTNNDEERQKYNIGSI